MTRTLSTLSTYTYQFQHWQKFSFHWTLLKQLRSKNTLISWLWYSHLVIILILFTLQWRCINNWRRRWYFSDWSRWWHSVYKTINTAIKHYSEKKICKMQTTWTQC